ncbi:MAG: hypothetical protein JO288_08730 [Hyphomicrobiales bacterium]|nr:hypothetical protein [Hyphomicrobiales bacterium]
MNILLDANLILLLVVGLSDPAYIGKHKRLSSVYRVEHFTLPTARIATERRLIFTPNTLAETSNLIDHIADPARAEINDRFRKLIQSGDSVTEEYLPSSAASEDALFRRLGLTDVVLMQLLGGSTTLLTADARLYSAALGRGLRAENFTHYLGY